MIALLLAVTLQTSTITGIEARNYIGRVATVCGTVASTRFDPQTPGGPSFLNLDHPFPKQSLTVVIFEADRAAFGEPETRFAQKRICATGTVEELTQPAGVLRIVVKSPDKLRIDGGRPSGDGPFGSLFPAGFLNALEPR